MSLPAELRNQIYALALTDPNYVYLVSKTKRYRRTVQRSLPFDGRSADYDKYTDSQFDTAALLLSLKLPAPPALPALVPNLLLLNKAIYAETQPILYAGNSFAVEDTTAMHTFLAKIGPKNRADITHLTVKGWGFTKAHKALNHPALTMLVDAVSLKRLYLDCQISWDAEPKRIAKQLYRDGFLWLEAVGAGKGKFDAGVDMIEIADEYLTRFLPRWEAKKTPDELREEFRAELRRLLS